MTEPELGLAGEAGERHAFRYLDVDGRWHDDPAADDVEPGENGVANCILDLTMPEPEGR